VILGGQQIADTANRICDLQQIGHEIAHKIARVISPLTACTCSKKKYGGHVNIPSPIKCAVLYMIMQPIRIIAKNATV
jgi:hypothetical protein